MGGSIAVTIREKDGKEHRMCRWTNPTPYFINDLDFVNNNPDHLNSYLKSWYEMRKDYIENRDTGKYENSMTPVYARHPHLAPCEYGLLLVDMQSDTIASCQGYTLYGQLDSMQVRLEIGSKRNSEKLFTNKRSEDANRFYRLLTANRIKSVLSYRRENGEAIRETRSVEEVFLGNLSPHNLAKTIVNTEQYQFFELDMSPYMVIKFNETEKGWTDFKKLVIDLKFKLSREEEAMWDEWMKNVKANS